MDMARKITDMTKANAVMLGDELMREAEKIAAKYGLNVKRGGGRYGEGEYKLNSVTFFVPASGSDSDESNSRYTPSQLNRFKINFEMNKGRYMGLDSVNVGDTYFDRSKGCDMKIIGWDTKKRKYPCLVECVVDGTTFKMSPNSLQMKFM